jgi:hypothetical protein
MVKGLQKLTFEPSPNQAQFAEIILNYDKKTTLEKAAEEIGITRQAIWKWYQDKNFVNWLNSKKDDLLDKSLMDRYSVAIRKAKAGDFQFSKLLFEMQGEYIPQQKLGGIEDKPININLIPVSDKSDVEKLKEND